MSNFSFEYFDSDEIPKLFATLKRVFDKADIPFYLIGARARDVWFLPQKRMRITKDIDWSVASEDVTIFQEILQLLIQNEGFSSTTNPYTLLSSEGTTVDFLPFVESSGKKLDGLEQVFQRGTEGVKFDDGSTYQVANLPAIVLLKFIAWDDRPEYRLKDLQDIAVIIDNYFDFFSEDIYDNHSDLFEDRELEEISAYVIGRKMDTIIGDSVDLKKRIIYILKDRQSAIAERLVIGSEKSIDTARKVLQKIY